MVTKWQVLEAAASISPHMGAEIVAAVQDATATTIREYAAASREDGLRGEGVAHDVAVRIAMDAGVEW